MWFCLLIAAALLAVVQPARAVEANNRQQLADMLAPSDQYESAADLKWLPGARLLSVVYCPGPEDWAYSHTPCIQAMGDKLVCVWVNCWRDEIEARTRVVFKTSDDGGHTWSPLKIAVDDPDGEGPEMRINGGLWKRGDDLYLLVTHARTGGPFGQPVTGSVATHLYQYNPTDETFTEVKKLKDDWWSHGNPLMLSDGNAMFFGVRDDHVTKELLIGGGQSLDDWKSVCDPIPAHIKRFSESSGYQLDNGQVVIYYRNNDPKDYRLYRAQCNPDSSDFQMPVKTDCPDSPSKQHAGRFPGGKFYVVGNLSHGTGREYLVYAESDDGYRFTRPQIIAHNQQPNAVRNPKETGLQYPTTTVIDGKLYIPVSRGKEDIYLYLYDPSLRTSEQ